MRRTLTSLTKNPCIIGDFDVAHDCVCFCRIAPWDCQEDAVTHDLRGRCHAWLGRCFLGRCCVESHHGTVKRTLSRMTGLVFSRIALWSYKRTLSHLTGWMFCRIALWYCQGTLSWPVQVFFFNCNLKMASCKWSQKLSRSERIIIIRIINYYYYYYSIYFFYCRITEFWG